MEVALEDKYKVTTDSEGILYIGITLKWDYEKVTFQISIPGYVQSALHLFQREKPQNTPLLTIPLYTTYL